MADLHARGDVLVLHQASEPGLIDHYWLVAAEILDELPRTGVIAVGIGTGLSITGIAGRCVTAARRAGASAWSRRKRPSRRAGLGTASHPGAGTADRPAGPPARPACRHRRPCGSTPNSGWPA
jgi:hypothetical protein